MRTAIERARTGRPGPVSVEIPIDQQYRAVDHDGLQPIAPPARPQPDAANLARAAELIRKAHRPLIWAGGGVIASDASAELVALAERIGAGVLTSAAGRGALPEDHPACVGFFPLDASVGALFEQCDLLLAVGTRFRGNETRTWQLALPTPRIQIDVEPSLLGRNYPIDVGIVSDARCALAALAEALPTRSSPEWLAVVADTRRAARARMRETLGPYARILDDLRSTLSRDAVVVRDVTIPATTWGARLLETYLPRTALYSATYAIGMGFGLAIGAAIGQPKRDVVLLAGDGGFVTALGELATIAQERARVRVVLFNDGGYGILRNLQDSHFDGRRFGVDLLTPDFPRLAETFGIWSGQVRSAVEMGPVLKEALQQDGPSLIEIDMAAVGPMATPFTGSARLVPGR
jgi:acetolactate synthase-1/2/3 large subunit